MRMNTQAQVEQLPDGWKEACVSDNQLSVSTQNALYLKERGLRMAEVMDYSG